MRPYVIAVVVMGLTLVLVSVYQNRVVAGQRATIQFMLQNPACVTPTPAELQQQLEQMRRKQKREPVPKADPYAHYMFNGGNSGRI